jgi:phage terminase large subunit-like protein
VEWSTACPDWERRIVAGESLVPCAPLFPAEAITALEVFKALRLKDVRDKPCFGDVARDWILDFVSAVFGAYDAETGRRLINEFLLLISKKNTKSTLAAGIMVTALIRNWREAGEFYILAPTIEVADNSFFPARDMVKEDPELSALLHVSDHHRLITHRTTGATLKVVAADSETVSGKKGIGVLVDELWLFGKKAQAENMLREATGGIVSRPEGFTIYLSTQSDEPPAGVFAQKLTYARKVRDGKVIDKSFMPVLYEFPKAMLDREEHLNPKNFYITNPNLGASVDEPTLVRKLAQEQESGPGSVRGFLSKHLNVEIGMALMATTWAGATFWEAATRANGVSFEQLLADSEVVVAGIDGGGLDDLMGLYLIGRERETGRWLGWGRAWAHDIVLERRKDIATKLLGFKADGDLTIVATPGDDVRELADIIERVNEAGLLPEENAIGCDPEGMSVILDELSKRGITVGAGAQVVGISQGWKMVGALTEQERRLKAKTFVHGAQPLMAWCVGNCREEPRGNARIITKQASGRSKIDPAMAMFDAVHLMALNPTATGGSSFWERAA